MATNPIATPQAPPDQPPPGYFAATPPSSGGGASSAPPPGYTDMGGPPQSMQEQGWLGHMWKWANTGLIQPDTFLKILTLGREKSVAEQHAISDINSPANLPKAGTPKMVGGKLTYEGAETPEEAAARASRISTSGMHAGEAETLSGLTSPLALGTAGLSSVAKSAGMVGKAARTALTGIGLGFGAKGISDVASGAQKGLGTPEGSEQALQGASQVAAAAPSVVEAGRGAASAAARVAPRAFATGEKAIVSALQPKLNDVPIVRDAIRTVGPDLQKSNVRSVEDLYSVASQQRSATGDAIDKALLARGGNTTIDAVAAANRIRAQINPLHTVESDLAGNLPKEAQAIKTYADKVEQNLLRRPISIGEADKLVQLINASERAYSRLSPDARAQMQAEGDPTIARLALKQSLNEQIDNKLGNYRDLKAKYGAWKELQNQSARRIDQEDASGTKVTYLQQRAMERTMGSLGSLVGLRHATGAAAGIGGGISAYLAMAAAADLTLERLSSPDRMIERGVKGLRPPSSPAPVGPGAMVQSVVSGKEQEQESNTFRTPLDAMMAAKRGEITPAAASRIVQRMTGRQGSITRPLNPPPP